MKPHRFKIAAAVVALTCGWPAVVMAAGQDDVDWCAVYDADPLGRFFDGDRSRRSTLIDAIQAGRHTVGGSADELENRREMECQAFRLQRYYSLVAGRQQTILATESWITGLASTGAALSEGAGAHTQLMWGYAALIPVLISRFNANEPIRDVNHGAVLATDWIAYRYIGLNRLIEQTRREADWTNIAGGGGATSFQPNSILARNGGEFDTSCRALTTALNGLHRLTTENEAGQTARLRQAGWSDGDAGDAQRVRARELATRCAEARVAQAQLEAFLVSADGAYGELYRQMGFDLAELDAVVRIREDVVTYSPFETFGALASAPFEAAASLLSGEDGREALERLRVQSAFNQFQRPLQVIQLAPAPASLAAAPAPVAGGPPALLDAWTAYESYRVRYNRIADLAQRIHQLASRTRVDVTYDASSGVVAVSLVEPPAA